MINYTKQAFTLIELLVVITIMVLISLLSYGPYQHYQTKQKVRNSTKIVSQNLYDARNLAINGVSSSSGNLSVGIYFGSGAKEIVFYGFAQSENLGSFNKNNYTNEKFKIKVEKLEPSVEITSFKSQNNGFILFDAISGSGNYFYFDSGGNKNIISSDMVDINLGFRGVSAGTLIGGIDYYTKTYVANPH